MSVVGWFLMRALRWSLAPLAPQLKEPSRLLNNLHGTRWLRAFLGEALCPRYLTRTCHMH